jgi:NAD(P)H-hydrate epimerase
MAILNRAQVRDVDRRAIQDYGMSGLVLMENAGRGVTLTLFRLIAKERREKTDRNKWPTGPVTIICGKGNNGGDGFVIARHLDLFGITVRVLLLTDVSELSGDAATNCAILRRSGFKIEEFSEPFDPVRFDQAIAGSAWLVDAMLGTGAIGEPKSPFADAIDRMNASNIPILAVDLPSGLDCDTGMPASHTIRAKQTCTFVAPKPGFFVPAAKPFVGEIEVMDIGVPRKLLEESEAEADNSQNPAN